MKKYVLLNKNLILISIVLLGLFSCSKDKEEGPTLPKIKAMTMTGISNVGINQKATFAYNQNGALDRLEKYVNGTLESYFTYHYDGNVLKEMKSYLRSRTSASYDLMANIKFTYSGERLTEIVIAPVNAAPSVQATKILFEYGSGDVPVKFNLSLSDGTTMTAGYGAVVLFPFLKGEAVTYEYKDRWTNPDQSNAGTIGNNMMSYQYEFDTKNNPLYKLPILETVVVDNNIAYVFTAPGYFAKNNPTKATYYLNDSPIVSFKVNYDYLSNGLPQKSTISSFSQTTYEYW